MNVKKFLSSVLAGAMVLGTMSFTAFADTKEVPDDGGFYEAVKNANDGAVIKLEKDITYKEPWVQIWEKENLTIHGNGHSITLEADPPIESSGNGNYLIYGAKNLNVSDLTINFHNEKGHGFDTNGGSFTNCTFNNGGFAVCNAGAVIFENCSFNNQDWIAIYSNETRTDEGYSGNTAGTKITNCTFTDTRAYIARSTEEISGNTIQCEDKSEIALALTAAPSAEANISNNTLGEGTQLELYTSSSTFSNNNILGSVAIDSSVTLDDTTFENNVLSDSVYEALSEKIEELAENNGRVDDAVAQIGDAKYLSLKDAVAAAQDGDTVTLLEDATGCGIVVLSGSNFTIDFGGHTYTVNERPLAGSTGTESQGFQLLKDSTLTFKNGTIAAGKVDGLYMVIQNYSNLTLEDMVIDGRNLENGGYAVSNNNGNTVFKGATSIYAPENGVAFDVCNWTTGGYPSVSVTIDESMTGIIDGKIEFTTTENESNPDTHKLEIKGGTFTVGSVETGSTSIPLADFVPGESEENVKIVSDAIAVQFRQAKPDDNTLWNIVLVGQDAQTINRLTTAEFTFEFKPESETGISYEIKNYGDVISNPTDVKDHYEFHFKGVDGVPDGTDKEITIGQVQFTGYGKLTFGVKANEKNIVHATKIFDSIVDTFDTLGAVGKGKLIIGEDLDENDDLKKAIDTTIKVPKQDLTVHVAFNNEIKDNPKDYQDMKAVISGGDLKEDITFNFGEGSEGSVGLVNGVYTFTQELTENTAYTVTITGAGYRTARYTVNMTGDKTLNFWNNVKDVPAEIEAGKTGVRTNFLAGDIVGDNNINIYDLSAVVSYFGSESTTANGYAKYDLNRDGVVDSKDVAYVLVSWGN